MRRVEQRPPLVGGGRDVEEYDVVGAVALILLGKRHGIPDVPQHGEAHALGHASAQHIETGDHSAREHQRSTVVATAPLVLNTASAVTRASRTANPSPLTAASWTGDGSTRRSHRLRGA